MGKDSVAFIAAVCIIGSVATVLSRSAPVSPAAFFPLAMHNTWTHEVTFSGGDYHYYMTGTVIRDNWQLQGQISYVVEEEYEPLTKRAPQAKSTVAYFHKDGFLLRYPWLDSEDSRIWDTQLGQGVDHVMPSPFVHKTSWKMAMENQVMFKGGKNSSSATAWIDPTEIQVPAGKFRNCLRVETVTTSMLPDPRKKTSEFSLFYVEWYARGVGLVKAVSSEGEGTLVKSVTELLSYTIR
jgi:hypothetical protein